MPPDDKKLGIDFEYDTGRIINDWRTAAPAGAYLTSGIGVPNDSPGWMTYKDDHLEASGGVPVMVQAKLREQHPALQEAWETYLALLHVCYDK